MQTDAGSKTPELSKYFTPWQWVTLILVIITGISLRWIELDTRPYHHDESQHAMFGKYFYDFPEIQYYKYDPMMHAPLLYNFMRLVYTSLGNTLWSARAPIALLGTIFLFLPLLFRRYFSPVALLCLIAAISLSPSLIYWSRFLIHDYFVIASMLLMLYGVVLARPEQRPFFVLIGITLQFCIKANVFVTLALLLGYLIYDLLLKYILEFNHRRFVREFAAFLKRYVALFFVILCLSAMLVHYLISLLDANDRVWNGLIQFSNNTFLFIGTWLLVGVIVLWLTFCSVQTSENYFRKIFSDMRNFWAQYLFSLAASILVFCYIFSSGFRHAAGILDGLFRKSIPYWLNQHDIERIKGPFLFNFYFLSWYEFAFMVFFGLQLYLFYRNAGKWFKIAGLVMLAVAVTASVGMFLYAAGGDRYLYLEEIGGREVAALSRPIDKFITFFVHTFKLKDALDVFGLVVLVVHPVILTTGHLIKGQRILAFWGYLFTASFFTYSFLGEKVPWLSVYPLIPGFIYLALFMDDWFKTHPIADYRQYPVGRIFKYTSLVLLLAGVLFVAETVVSISGMLSNLGISPFFKLFTKDFISSALSAIKIGVLENNLIFTLGFLIYAAYLFDGRLRQLGRINLVTFIFVITALFCLRASVLTNFVHAGSETEFISQVHTTREFHAFALKLRDQAKINIKPDDFKILGDGDPVWPLTWYMVGVEHFRFTATPAERKNFDIIIQTYEDNPTNVPDGFERRRITLRGWWVPEYGQMTLKRFLNYSFNHTPWSNSGFTYAWLLVNRAKS